MLITAIHYLDEDFKLQGPADLWIHHDKIRAIGPVGSLDQAFEAECLPCDRYKGQGKLLVPGFFNAHCHLPMTLLRGYGEGLPLQAWLHERIFPFEALLEEEDFYWGSLLAVAELVSTGACGVSDMYFGLAGILRAVEETGIKANLSWACSNADPEAHYRTESAFAGNQLTLAHAKAHPHGRIKADLALHAEYSSHPKLARSVIEEAKALDAIVQVHVSETAFEHEDCKRRRGMTPLAYLDSLGYFAQPLVLAHCVHLEASDYALLSERIQEGAKVSLVHNPSSNLKLASGFAPLKRWEEAGVNLAIGTDGAASNNNLDMFEEVQLASLLQKAVNQDPAYFGPSQALKAASLGGALAQGRAKTGLIKEGMQADLLVFDLSGPHCQPLFDPLANLLHAAKSADLCLTLIDGQCVYKDGEWPLMDMERIRYEVRRIRNEKLSALGQSLAWEEA